MSIAVIKVGTFESYYRLIVDCEDKYSGELWRGKFKNRYIEEMTTKAKNPKQFAVFVKMLLAGFKREVPDEILLDLLTQNDLEQLKQRKTNSNESIGLPDDPRLKKYLILTLKGEYEKTHYPLPLSFLEEPDALTLRRTFTRLQGLIQLQNSNGFSQY